MNDLKKIIRPSNAVFVITAGVFFFWVLLELSTLSTRTSTSPSNFLNIFRWPGYVSDSIYSRYLEIHLPYDKDRMAELSKQPNQRVVSDQEYMVVYREGGRYSVILFFVVLFSVFLAVFNFYLLALLLYWLARGVKKIIGLS